MAHIVEFFTLNIKVLPADDNSHQKYASLFRNWLTKGFKISLDKDSFFTLTKLVEIESIGAYYGVIGKFISLESVEFEDNEGNLVEFEIPDDVRGRINQYEFILIPECHRIALVKKGKIDKELTKRGAPLKKLMEVIRVALNNVLPNEENVIVDLTQSKYIFEEIFTSDLLSLEAKISYTNDDDLEDENKKLIENLISEPHIGEFFTRMKPDSTGKIDSSKPLIRGLLGLARENGRVKAWVRTPEGERKTINTENHPEIGSVTTLNNSSNRFLELVRKIYRTLIGRYRPNQGDENESK